MAKIKQASGRLVSGADPVLHAPCVALVLVEAVVCLHSHGTKYPCSLLLCAIVMSALQLGLITELAG